MKSLVTALALLLSGASFAPASAQSASAQMNANCNASFKGTCPAATTTQLSTTTTVSEAPLPLLAASPLAALVLAGVYYAVRRRRLA